MIEAKISILAKLWQEIENGLQAQMPDLPAKSDDSDVSEARIRRFVTGQRNYKWHGLYYKLDANAMLGIEVEDSIGFGVYCEKGPNKENIGNLPQVSRGGKAAMTGPCFEIRRLI